MPLKQRNLNQIKADGIILFKPYRGKYYGINQHWEKIYGMQIYQTPPHKVNFKRNLTCFNSEFSFSYISCLPKTEEPSLPTIYP